MRCKNPVTIKKNLDPALYPNGLEVPCGKCFNCRIQKRSEWSLRMLHELDNHADSCFITLTYSDNNLLANRTLAKPHLQLFFKRLRRSLGDVKIRYYACGEYGDKTNRPHYHAIIFGLSLRDEDKLRVMNAWPHADWSVPSIRRQSFGLAEPDSIRYVAQYIDKKLSGVEEKKINGQGRISPFRLCSLGLGGSYCDSNSEQIASGQVLTYRGTPVSVPRYYLKRLGLDTELLKEHAYYTACEEVEKHTGLNIHPDVLKYEYIDDRLLRSYLKGVKESREQNDRNLKAKKGMRSSTL